MDSLKTQMANPEGLIFHDRGFIDFIEMHLADLRAASVSEGMVLDVTENDKVRAKRNFHLLCNIAGVPFYLHWITMRVNMMHSPNEFDPKTAIIYAVSASTLGKLQLAYTESQRNT